MNNEIVIEKAKDNNWTCKVEIDGKWKYLYSKYKPVRPIEDIQKEKNYIVLGLGLGYELKQILEKTNGEIYVIEKDKSFYSLIKELDILDCSDCDKVKFLFEDEYKKVSSIYNDEFIIYDNKTVTELDSKFYFEVVKSISNKVQSNIKQKVVFYEHITIADDCVDTLRDMGYDVVKLPFSTSHQMTQDIIKEMPDFIFTINLSEKVSEISDKLSIPYVAWIVDIPAYSLYSDLIKSKNLLVFTCDETTVSQFGSRGFKNIIYMPVAANTKRLDNISIDSEEAKKYSCDISFLGTTGVENEFNKYIYSCLSKETLMEIENIFNTQYLNPNKFVFKDLITDRLIEKIQEESGYSIKSERFLDRTAKLSFLLGRKYNELQRINMVTELSKKYNMYVYGDEYWKNIECDSVQYKGYAEHFNEMPKVFKSSKINVNYTRVYVESGMPMRIFDILGSKGFLATNYKDEIDRYFIDGKDLIKYRDTKDLLEITEYYLNNEKERQEILLNGYYKVKEYHTYDIRLKEIMKIVKNYFAIN